MGVGGAGSNAGDLLVRDERPGRGVEPEYRKGVWVYVPCAEYCRGRPAIETTATSDLIVRYVELAADRDIIVLDPRYSESEQSVSGKFLEKPVDITPILRVIRCAAPKGSGLHEGHLHLELTQIGELERTLRREVGNYRERQ